MVFISIIFKEENPLKRGWAAKFLILILLKINHPAKCTNTSEYFVNNTIVYNQKPIDHEQQM